MPKYPFSHDGPVYAVSDDKYELIYYSRGDRKYRRVRHLSDDEWSESVEYEIDNISFWVVVACIERGSRHA